MLSSTFYLVLAFVSLLAVVSSSAITTYTDATCKKSFNNLDVVNGYPDGVCTPTNIIGNIHGFQIAKLDPGCAVTLYGPDETNLICSSSVLIVAEFGTCYNSSWAYYSIDGCSPPTSSSIILPTSAPTPTHSLSQTPSTFPSTIFTSPSPSANTGSRSNYTGVIAGGIVAGVAVVALVFGVTLFCLRRNHRKRDTKPLPSLPSFDLPTEHTRIQAVVVPRLRDPEKPLTRPWPVRPLRPPELWGQEAAAEIGRNSRYIPPAELPGDAMIERDKKGINPLIKIHTVR